ncbi:hypothetical protein HYX10_02965 [Candidatus Woesearchaeota archaeon]|nr:hypothetical protein [Candidatus Woesearchaeota archaeon]
MAKRGQYFTIDAFVAMLVVATGLVLVLALNTYQPSTAQPEVLSQEFVNTLAQVKIKEMNNPFVAQQLKGGNITNPDNTLLQQVYEYYSYFDSFLTGCSPSNPCHGFDPVTYTNMSAELLASVAKDLVPAQYSYEILVDGVPLNSRGTGQQEAKVLISSKRIIFGIVNKSVEFWGPIVVEVRIWQ